MGRNGRNIGVHIPLIVFDQHPIVAPGFDELRSYLALRQQDISIQRTHARFAHNSNMYRKNITEGTGRCCYGVSGVQRRFMS
jgi:hypothetical protein